MNKCILRFVSSKQFIPEYLQDLFYDGDRKRINSTFEYYYTLNGKLLSEDEYKKEKYIQHHITVVIDNKYHLSKNFYEMCFIDSSKMALWRDARIEEIFHD